MTRACGYTCVRAASIPRRAIRANSGETLPPWGVPAVVGQELARFENPRVEPGFDAAEYQGASAVGQEGRMTDTVEALGDIHFQRVLRSKPNTEKDGFDRIPAAATWAKAVGMRRQLGFPFRLQGLATSVCRARSPWVGMLNGRCSGLPRLGIHVRRSGWLCHRGGAWWPGATVAVGVSLFTPSMPAVCLPRLSWVTDDVPPGAGHTTT